MKKSYNLGKSLSKGEFALMDAAKNAGIAVLDADAAEKLTGFKRLKIYRLLNSLKRKGFLKGIIRGKYATGAPFADAPSIANALVWPSYVSFWSALNHYQLTEQMPKTFFLATTKKRKELTFNGQKLSYVKLSPKRFFGYTKADNLMMAEKEKAVIDCLLLPRYAGGIGEVFKCMREGWASFDKKKLAEYAVKIKNASLLRRLGFLITFGKLKIDAALLEGMHKKIGGTGFSKLDPASGKGAYDAKWRIIINVSEFGGDRT